MKIAQKKLDKRGRVSIPRSFLKVNGIKNGTFVIIKSGDKPNHIVLEFLNKNVS